MDDMFDQRRAARLGLLGCVGMLRLEGPFLAQAVSLLSRLRSARSILAVRQHVPIREDAQLLVYMTYTGALQFVPQKPLRCKSNPSKIPRKNRCSMLGT